MQEIEFIALPQTSALALFEEVPNTGRIFDTLAPTTTPRPLPGQKLGGESYIPWGEDNHLPDHLCQMVRADEVCAQNLHFAARLCYGTGLHFEGTAPNDNCPTESDLSPFATESLKPTHKERPHTRESEAQQVKHFCQHNNLPAYFINQCVDMKYFAFSLAVIILNREGTAITRLHHKEALHARFAPAIGGRIPYVYCTDWQAPTPQSIERLPLLDEEDPLGDLQARLKGGTHRGQRYRPTNARKFAILMRFPTVGDPYYPEPTYTAVFRGGSYEEKRMISLAKRARLRNHSSLKYHVEIERGYWQRLCESMNITDPEQQVATVKARKEEIKNYLSGIENSGKVWFSAYYVDPNGQEVRDIRISIIERQKEGGDWGEDLNIAANTICYGFGLHPNLVGAVPGKSGMNNSGSDKRELYTMLQALETPYHQILLTAPRLVAHFNQWQHTTVSVGRIELTTLDTHHDFREH